MNERKTKVIVLGLIVLCMIIMIAGIAYNIAKDRERNAEKAVPVDKVEKNEVSAGAAGSDFTNKEDGGKKDFVLSNEAIAPGIKITSLNGKYDPAENCSYPGLSIQLSYKAATPVDQVSYEIYSTSGVTDAYMTGEMTEALVNKSANLIDRIDYSQVEAFPADILYWLPTQDADSVLMTVRVKKRADQAEFMRFGIVIEKGKDGKYQMTKIKDVELKNADDPKIADIAYESLPDILKELITSKAFKVSAVERTSNIEALYVKPDDKMGAITELEGQIGVTFNFAQGSGLSPITVYLDKDSLYYLGYDKYDQVRYF